MLSKSYQEEVSEAMKNLEKELRKLFEGKRCFVRCSIVQGRDKATRRDFLFTQDFPRGDLIDAHREQHNFIAKELAKKEG